MIVMTERTEYRGGPSAVALGMFDGVHLGHQALIRTAVAKAREQRLTSIVCTFDVNPLEVLCPERAPRRLLTQDENLAKFEQLGADAALITHFTRAYAAQPPEEFLRELVERLEVRVIVTGENYTFGYRGTGDAQLLKRLADRYGYEACVVPPVRDEEGMISSTRIRAMLANGELERAERLLRIAE